MKEIGEAFVKARIAAAAKAFMPKSSRVKITCDKHGNIKVKIKNAQLKEAQDEKESNA